MSKIENKIIVITGTSSGIGKYLADYFSKNNTVIGLCRTESENSIRCDLSNPDDVENAVNTIKEKYGQVDILINNAGYGLTGAVETVTDEEIRRIFEVNFFSALSLIRKILPLMKSGSKIINVSSACALFALPFKSMYCASKSALSMLSYSLKMELAPSNIQVTAICPGDVQTPFTTNRKSNYTTNKRYSDSIKATDEKLAKRNSKRMSLNYAGKKMAKIIEKKRLKPTYIVGNKHKFLFALSKIFPQSLFLYFTRKFM